MTDTAPQYVAFRAFRSAAAEASGKRGRRLVIDLANKQVTALGSNVTDEGTTFGGIKVETYLGEVGSMTALKKALKESKTPIVIKDEALSEYVSNHDGQLPLEGLNGDGPDDFVDSRPQAVARRESRAKRSEAAAA